MDNDSNSASAFIKIQDVIFELTGCVSFKISDGAGGFPMNTVLVETRQKIHPFCFLTESEAKAAMRCIESSIQDAGYALPEIRS
jgi:hypothetical protein